jgi:spore germination protein GerM
MNFAQRLGLFILILISVVYVYFSFFNHEFKFPERSVDNQEETQVYNPLNTDEVEEKEIPAEVENKQKTIKIFLLDKSGNIRSVNRICNTNIESSCFEYSIKELMSSPTKWEKSKGLTSEIPQGTKILSIRESSGNALIDLSSDFETGGGAESIYMRVKQVIKTATTNTSLPVYLYINGKQANVIGGEGIMIKQPLNERSLDE